MIKVLNRLIVVLAGCTLLTIPWKTALAGWGSNGILAGLTWFSEDYHDYHWWWDGLGMSYLLEQGTVYNLWVKIRTYNDCDYVHQVSYAESDAYWVGSTDATAAAGSNQCQQGPSWVRTDGEHALRYYPYGSYTTVNTSEYKDVSGY